VAAGNYLTREDCLASPIVFWCVCVPVYCNIELVFEDDRGRAGGTIFILRIKEQETHLTVHEHDDDDDDDDELIFGVMLTLLYDAVC
jgi:hypothetical protein